MGLSNTNMFNKYKELVKNRNEEASKKVADDRFVQMKAGNVYRMRLLYYTDENLKRTEPFIEQYNHVYWDEVSREFGKIICPSSEYVHGVNGFQMCPVCRNNNKLWKDSKNGSETAKQLYRQFKRKLNGYALVFMINDPVNPENNGKVKILRYGTTIADFFKAEILGETKGKDKDNVVSDPVGSDAFDLDAGYDFILSVTSNPTPEGTFNAYSCKFAREKTSVNVDVDKLEAEIKLLKFDEDFYVSSTKEEIQEFYTNYVLDSVVSDIPESSEANKINETTAAEVIVQEKPKVEEVKEEQIETQAVDSEFNLDDVLKDIEKEYS